MTPARCPNCDRSGYDEKRNHPCRHCGYVAPEVRAIVLTGPIVWCATCGCNYTDRCTNGHAVVEAKL